MIVLQSKSVRGKRMTVAFTGNTGDLGGYFPSAALTNRDAAIFSQDDDSVLVLRIYRSRLYCDNQDLVQELNSIDGYELTITESSILTRQNVGPGEEFGQRILVSISIKMPSGNEYTFTPAPEPKGKRMTVAFRGDTSKLSQYFPRNKLTDGESSIRSYSYGTVLVLEIDGIYLRCDNRNLLNEFNSIEGDILIINESSIVTRSYNSQTILVSVSVTMPSGNQYKFDYGWWVHN
jgi:hypothetical protein